MSDEMKKEEMIERARRSMRDAEKAITIMEDGGYQEIRISANELAIESLNVASGWLRAVCDKYKQESNDED